MLESTNDFISKLNQFQFSLNHKLVSFDVTSLFTNVSLNETIRLIADTIYSEENSSQTHSLVMEVPLQNFYVYRNDRYVLA